MPLRGRKHMRTEFHCQIVREIYLFSQGHKVALSCGLAPIRSGNISIYIYLSFWKTKCPAYLHSIPPAAARLAGARLAAPGQLWAMLWFSGDNMLGILVGYLKISHTIF